MFISPAIQLDGIFPASGRRIRKAKIFSQKCIFFGRTAKLERIIHMQGHARPELTDNSKVIAWIAVNHGPPGLRKCDLELRGGKQYLSFPTEDGGRHAEEIDPARVSKILPESWDGAGYIYRKIIKLTGPAKNEAGAEAPQGRRI